MKKITKFLLLLIILFTLTCCSIPPEPPVKEEYVVTVEYNNGEGSNEFILEEGSTVKIEEKLEYEDHTFGGWYLDEQLTIPLTAEYIISSNITVYAKWDIIKNKVIFYNGDQIFKEQMVAKKEYAEDPGIPTKEGYEFSYWSTTPEGEQVFNFNKRITKETNVYAQFIPKEFTIKYDLGFEVFYTKRNLYIDFFTDFYNFMVEYTQANFLRYSIDNAEQFLAFCENWNSNGKDSFGGVGDAFGKYFVAREIGGTLDSQPETSFIGYCYKNKKYVDFIPHLMEFFAYWRTDEGYTGGPSDPNNLGNDFFASPWAALVDTCKFFYFTSDNLNDTYPWFRSERVKNALDNVPGLETFNYPTDGTIESPVILIDAVRNGYTFLGWFDEDGNQITEVYKEMTVYAKWEKQE